jgi:hypothetical protein
MTHSTRPDRVPTRTFLTLFITAMLSLSLGARVADDPPPAAPQEEPEPPSAEFIEYRSLPELGQITITDGVVRGAKAVARLEDRAAHLAKRGIFACTDAAKPHVYRRTDEVDGRRIETTVVINPPEDEESDWTRHVTVRVDGRKKVDCSIGESPEGDVFVAGVTVFPEDGTVDVVASDAEGSTLVPPEGFEKLDERGVITDDNLQPPPDNEEPEKPKTEKV